MMLLPPRFKSGGQKNWFLHLVLPWASVALGRSFFVCAWAAHLSKKKWGFLCIFIFPGSRILRSSLQVQNIIIYQNIIIITPRCLNPYLTYINGLLSTSQVPLIPSQPLGIQTTHTSVQVWKCQSWGKIMKSILVTQEPNSYFQKWIKHMGASESLKDKRDLGSQGIYTHGLGGGGWRGML